MHIYQSFGALFFIIGIIYIVIPLQKADLWTETERMSNLQQVLELPA